MAQSEGAWSPGVDMETTTLGRYRTVTSARQAAEMLLFDWPITHGRKYSKAQLECLRAMEGKGDIDKARSAFLDAAEEAGLFVRKH